MAKVITLSLSTELPPRARLPTSCTRRPRPFAFTVTYAHCEFEMTSDSETAIMTEHDVHEFDHDYPIAHDVAVFAFQPEPGRRKKRSATYRWDGIGCRS